MIHFMPLILACGQIFTVPPGHFDWGIRVAVQGNVLRYHLENNTFPTYNIDIYQMKPCIKETEDEPNLHWTSCLACHPRLSVLGEQNPITRICNSSPLLLSKKTSLSAVRLFVALLFSFVSIKTGHL